MKRLLLPFFAALVFPVQAGVDPEVHKACKDVKDYMGCVKMMRVKETRQLVDSSGVIVLFNPDAVVAKEVGDKWGRFINYRYVQKGGAEGWGLVDRQFNVDGDCKNYSVNITGIENNWINLKSSTATIFEKHRRILDEFCPQMNQLVKAAKSDSNSYFRYPNSNNGVNLEGQQVCPKGTKYYEYSYGKTFFGAKVGKWKTSGYCLTDGEAAQMEMGVNNANSRRKQRMLDRTLDRLNRPTITCTTYGTTTTCR